jgi:hypothetical protein
MNLVESVSSWHVSYVISYQETERFEETSLPQEIWVQSGLDWLLATLVP